MNIEIIKENISTEIIGRNLVYFPVVESTNSLLMELAVNEIEDGSVLISDSQSGGRGRLGRDWFSPPGVNLYTSVLLRPEINAQNSAVFTFIASLALVDTIENLNVASRIKWPNDILIDNKKVAGVLTEMKSIGNKLDYIIVGIGLNINLSRELIEQNLRDISKTVTSLGIECGEYLDRETVAAKLINNLDKYYLKFIREGINSIVADWTVRWGLLNEYVSIKVDNSIINGFARKIDNFGFLYIEDEKGNLNKIITGDMLTQ